MMRTLFLQAPSFDGFDGGAGSRFQTRREVRSFWYPTWLAQPAALVPGSKLVDVSRCRHRGPRLAPEELIPPPPKGASLAGLKVLVVDDDARNLFALKSALEERGIRVLHAGNGKVALDLLQEHDDVDLVLMDTMMPEMDGLSATRAIRVRVRYRSLPDHLAHREGHEG